MSLSTLKKGTYATLADCTANQQTKSFLESLGFINGTQLYVLNRVNGDMIIKIRNSRIAISSKLAKNILIS